MMNAMHTQSVFKVNSVTTVNVAATLHHPLKHQHSVRQHMLMEQLSSLNYFTHQGLGTRGHDDSEGNLCQLLELRTACEGN